MANWKQGGLERLAAAWTESMVAGRHDWGPEDRVAYAPEGGAEEDVDHVPTRSEVDDTYKWNLADLYTTEEAWKADVEKARSIANDVAALAGKLSEGAGTLLKALQYQDAISEKLDKVFAYAMLRRDEDTTSAAAQSLYNEAMTLSVEASQAVSFFEPEVLSIPEETLQGFLAGEPGLAQYDFLLKEMLRQKPHVLSAEQEQLLAAAGEITSAPRQIFTMFNNADTRFPKIKDEEGREIEVTHGRYSQFLESKDRRVRKDAFEAVAQTYAKHKNTLAALYGASVKKDVFYARVRNYESARAMALEADNVPISVYDNLIAAVTESLPALHRYYSLRKRVLKLDELHTYDTYVSIVPDVDIKVPYDEAVKTVAEAVAPLGDEYARIATEGMASRWIDVYETRGKTSGGYNLGVYGAHPYILLNYHDTLDNMFTLAHEMGHAMHSHFSTTNQPVTYGGYTIFVAEVASTCNEALLLHHLLEKTTDKMQRAYLINHQIETIRGTLVTQTLFAEFEKMTHEYAEQGGALTPEWLADTYLQLTKKYYGPEATIDDIVGVTWSRIPHFYRAFYVYKYATGISAATALAQKILTEGAPAVERYLEFLKSGSSDYSINLLRKAGVDMESPEPVRNTLNLFDSLVTELSNLLEG